MQREANDEAAESRERHQASQATLRRPQQEARHQRRQQHHMRHRVAVRQPHAEPTYTPELPRRAQLGTPPRRHQDQHDGQSVWPQHERTKGPTRGDDPEQGWPEQQPGDALGGQDAEQGG